MEKAASGIAVEETEEEIGIQEAIERMLQEEEDIELAQRREETNKRRRCKVKS